MTTIYASKTKNLLLGYVGENDCTQIVFDVIDAWLAEYPNATIGLYNRPSHQTQSYPVASLHRSGTVAVWTVKSSDLTADGRGECQLVCIDNGIVKKSACWDTTVMPALDGSGPPPGPWESWQQEFIDLKNDAAASASDAALSAAAASDSQIASAVSQTAAAASAASAAAAAALAQQYSYGVSISGTGLVFSSGIQE